MTEKDTLNDILNTGDGSENTPFIVTDIAQERLVLNHLGKIMNMQRLVTVKFKPHDCIECSDGTSVWFDVSQTPAWAGDIYD